MGYSLKSLNLIPTNNSVLKVTGLPVILIERWYPIVGLILVESILMV